MSETQTRNLKRRTTAGLLAVGLASGAVASHDLKSHRPNNGRAVSADEMLTEGNQIMNDPIVRSYEDQLQDPLGLGLLPTVNGTEVMPGQEVPPSQTIELVPGHPNQRLVILSRHVDLENLNTNVPADGVEVPPGEHAPVGETVSEVPGHPNEYLVTFADLPPSE